MRKSNFLPSYSTGLWMYLHATLGPVSVTLTSLSQTIIHFRSFPLLRDAMTLALSKTYCAKLLDTTTSSERAMFHGLQIQ